MLVLKAVNNMEAEAVHDLLFNYDFSALPQSKDYICIRHLFLLTICGCSSVMFRLVVY